MFCYRRRGGRLAGGLWSILSHSETNLPCRPLHERSPQLRAGYKKPPDMHDYVVGHRRRVPKDTARSIKTPSNLRESDKTTLTWDQLRSALAKLGLRDRILLKLDMTNALRPSELFGLKWKCFDAKASAISIQETTYRGKIRPYGKTRGSLITVPIAAELAEELVEWRKQSKDPSPEAFIFPGRLGGLHGYEQLPSPCVAQAGRGVGTAETDVPGDPAHHRYAGPEEGYGEGCAGHDAALTNGHDDGCLYAGATRRRAGDDQLHSPGVDEHRYRWARICNVRCRLIFTSNRTTERERRGDDGSHNKGRERVFRARRKHKFKTFRDEGF